MKETVLYHQKGKDAFYKTWHASQEHLIIYFASDGGSLVCAEKIFPIKKGVLAWIGAETYHYTMPDDPLRYDRNKLTLSPQRARALFSLFGDHEITKAISDKAIIYAKIPREKQEEVDRIFSEFSLCTTKDEESLLLTAACLKLLLYLKRYSTDGTSAIEGVVGVAIEYINRNVATALTIDEIASAVGVSKHHFCRLFKKHTGLTVMQYVLKTRIVLAKQELYKTGLTVTEISYKFGFSSPCYFCRVFQKEEGLSPLQYRKKKKA